MTRDELVQDEDGFVRRTNDKTRMLQDSVTGEWYDPAGVSRVGRSRVERLLGPLIEAVMNVGAVCVIAAFLITAIYMLGKLAQLVLWGLGG